MLTIKLCCVLLLFIILAECGKTVSRQNAGLKKESNRVGRRPGRNEVFDNLFNVYDTSFLAVVWPRITNGMHILVNHSCWEDLGFFFKELTDGRAWAYTALDATGRYSSALFTGNRFWLGSKEQCLRLNKHSSEANEIGTNGKNYYDDDTHSWRWVMEHEVTKRLVADRWPPYTLAYTTAEISLNITKFNMMKSTDITLGLCMPHSCSAQDIISVINFSILINDNLKTNKTTSRSVKLTSVRRVQPHYDIASDYAGILLISITAILAALSVVATIIDLDLTKCLPYASKSMTFDLEKYNTDPNRTVDTDIEKYENDAEKIGGENANNMNYLSLGRMVENSAPSIARDVNYAEKTGSCKRCGKYKKQCSYPRQVDNLPQPHLVNNSIASLSMKIKKKNIFVRLLLCFSLAYCWKRILNTNTANKDLSLIHAMRILSTFWIIFVHVTVIVDYISDDAGDINGQNNIFVIIATGTIAFDTLFYASGLFSSHHFFFLKSQYSVKELVGCKGVCGQILQFVCFVTNRVIRLLPSYAYAVVLTGLLARSLQTTATLALPDGEDDNCREYWWRNLLYISTLYPVGEQCMQVSWFLSTETQLHMLGALFCAASVSSSMGARMCAALALAGLLSSTIADASAAYFDFAELFPNSFGAYAKLIERPWGRVAPYFIGVFTGWLIHIIRGKLHVSKVTSSLLWMASLSFMFTSSAVPMVGIPWLAAWVHLIWPVALLWPVLMGTTNLAGMFRRLLGGSSVAALSRLCYGMLLLHGIVTRTVLLSVDAVLCSSTTCIWLYYAGIILLTLLASFLLSLLVEMPCCSLLRRISDCAS